jgi:DNA-binding GntR family transcriptional regulator
MTRRPAQMASHDRTKAERVYQTLRRSIRELSLPPGAPLRKHVIALEQGVSRAPVSEAIARLADEALVDVFPQHGSFVAPIRAQDVRESLFIRTALEVEAARRAAQGADAALIARLRENLAAQERALQSDDHGFLHDLDEALHATIFDTQKAPRALRLLDAARASLDRPRRAGLSEPGRAVATLVEHRRLVDSIASGDPELAATAMRAHMMRAACAVERQLVEIGVASG